MSLGGRPKEEGGHTPLKITVNEFTRQALEKVDNKSQFLEKAVKPLLEQLDPGPACNFIQQVDEQINGEINQALKNNDYDKIQTFANIAESLKDYRKLCELPTKSSLKLKHKEKTEGRFQGLREEATSPASDNPNVQDPLRLLDGLLKQLDRHAKQIDRELGSSRFPEEGESPHQANTSENKGILRKKPIRTWLKSRRTLFLKEPILAKLDNADNVAERAKRIKLRRKS